MTNKMQPCRLIYCSLTALHVSSGIFPHHQEHLNCIYSFWYYSRMSLPTGVMDELERSCLCVMLRVFELRPLSNITKYVRICEGGKILAVLDAVSRNVP
jgi:hypothetical protein